MTTDNTPAAAVAVPLDAPVGRPDPKRDLVDRLRQVHLVMSWGAAEDLLREAADEVERLRLALLTARRPNVQAKATAACGSPLSE